MDRPTTGPCRGTLHFEHLAGDVVTRVILRQHAISEIAHVGALAEIGLGVDAEPGADVETDDAPFAVRGNARGLGLIGAGRKTANAEKQKKVASALVRYRVLAWITGLWLLFLTGEMVYKYLILDNSADAPSWLFYIGQIHGLFYMLYLGFTIDLAIKARWKPGTTVATALAGTIPFLSFVFEHKRTAQVKQAYQL